MYTASKSSNSAETSASSQPESQLTYWTDSRMARPNPSVSNCGLVIVQVQPEQIQRNTQQYAEPNRYYSAESSAEQPLTTWSNITLDNRVFLTESNMNPVMNEDDDEGYRTSPGSDTSPQSPPKNIAKKMLPPSVTSQQMLTSQQSLQRRKQMGHNLGANGEESNNLMWLLDFKLDFFNEGQDANGRCIGKKTLLVYWNENCSK